MRHRSLLRLTLVVALTLLTVAHAWALPLRLVPPAPHGPGPGAATISFMVEVADGFTTTLAVDKGTVLIADDGSAMVEVQPFGIIDPSVEFLSFSINYGSLDTIDRTFGTAEIPISIMVSEAYILGPIPERSLGQALLGEIGSLSLVLGDLDLLVAGTVVLPGGTLPFSITEADLVSGLSNPAFRPNASDDVDFFNIDVRSAYVDLGVAGGLDVRLQVWNMGADNIQFVPEASTALLLACGLAGIAVAGRRRR